MKKKLLFLGALALSSLSAFAQWTLPEVKGSDLVPGDTCYIYNKEAGAFLRGLGSGNPYWGSRAGVSTEGVDPFVIYPALKENVKAGTEASNLYDIPWMEEWDNETYIIGGYAGHIDSPRWDEIWFGLMDYVTIWVDRQHDANANVNFFWNIEKNDKGTYYISISKKSTVLADPELYAELTVVDETTGEVTSAPVIVGGEKLGVDLANADLVTCFEGYNEGAALAYEWIFVSKEDYEAIDFEGFSRYYEAISLKNLIDESKATYPSVDFSAAEAVYNNTASTLAELQAAKELVKKAILDFQAGDASPANPKDMTAAITNPTFDEIDNFEGWSGSGFAAGGTKSTCAELYDKSSFNTYQDLQNLPMGVYKVGVKGFYRAGSIDNDWNTKDDPTYRHAKLYARSGADSLYTAIPSLSAAARETQVAITTDNGETAYYGVDNGYGYYVPNTMLEFTYFKEAENSTIQEVSVLVPVNDNKLRIGVVKNAHIGTDWCIVDDFTLEYYGNSLEAYVAWKDQMLAGVPTLDQLIPEDAIYNEAYKTAYEDAINTANSATDIETITSAIQAINPAIEALQANIIAYAAWKAKVDEIEAYFADNSDLIGDSVDYITDYIGDETEPGEYYPNGGAIYIAENALLTTEQITAELANVERWFQAAVRDGMAPGSDVSFLLINPSFKDGFNGWTYKAGAVGGKADVCPNVEVFENIVDVYQVVEGVPAGIYSINVQAFERPAANGSYDGTEEALVYLFMNEFQTPVMNIAAGALPEEQAQDQVNCWTGATDWQVDYLFTSSDGSVSGYVPNSMTGASYAFAGGRYVNTCYGIVGEDGVMKIGLTSNGVKGGAAHWVLWANFKLIYEGQNEDAIAAILESTIANVNEYMNNHSGEMNALAINNLGEALGNAEEALSEDYDTMYGALTALNAAQAAAREHVAAYAALTNAQMLMDEASYIYTETASIEALEAYAATSAKLEDIDNMTTEEIIALTEECNYVTAALKVPADITASDDAPLDMTSIIVNPDFSTGDASGWTYEFAAITNIGYQGANYTNGEVSINQFIEGWRSGNNPIGDGSIEQTLKALPAGTYVLAADICANDQGGTKESTAGFYLFAEEEGGKKFAIEVATGNGLPEHFELTINKETQESDLTIGIMTLNAAGNWLAADNFTLTYYGTESAKVPAGDATGIESVESVEVISSTYYTLGGAKVAAPVKGINIVKSVLSNGKVKVQKVFVK